MSINKDIEDIDVGYPYFQLDPKKDTKQEGDEYWSIFGECWAPADVQKPFEPERIYRRRITPPEGYEIVPEGEKVDNDCKCFRFKTLAGERTLDWVDWVMGESYGTAGAITKGAPELYRAFARKIKDGRRWYKPQQP